MTITAPSPATGPPAPGGVGAAQQFVLALRDAWPALAGYAAIRLLGLLVLAGFAWRADESVISVLNEWDGGWYIGIAEHGYDTGVRYDADGLIHTNVAFFPLFPWLIRLVSLLGIPPTVAGVLVASLAGVAAAWGIFRIGASLHSRSVGVVLAVLWGALPHAIVENMTYTESLFTALSAWALWALLERRWLLAGVLTLLAGLSRPTAAALVVAVIVGCILAVRRGEGAWQPWLAAALAPLGLIGYLAWCAIALGRPDGYFWMQNEGWGNRTDFGYEALHEIAITATHERPLAVYATTLVLGVSIILMVLLIADRRAPAPLIIFAGLIFLIALIQGGVYYYVKARFLIPAFPLLIPLALALDRTRPLARHLVLGVLVLLSAWYGTYLTLVWVWSP